MPMRTRLDFYRYSGTNTGSAPLDACAHDWGDVNWGDLVSCSIGVSDSQFIPNQYGQGSERSIAYTTLSDAFAEAKVLGYDPADGPVMLVGGERSNWPAPGALFSEICGWFEGKPGKKPDACV